MGSIDKKDMGVCGQPWNSIHATLGIGQFYAFSHLHLEMNHYFRMSAFPNISKINLGRVIQFTDHAQNLHSAYFILCVAQSIKGFVFLKI